MGKISKAAGATTAAGPVRTLDQRGGVDLELTGPTSDVLIGGDLTLRGNLRVDGVTTLQPLASNEVDVAEITDTQTGLAVNGLAIVPVDLLTVTLPDLDVAVWVFAQVWMRCSVANANLYSAVANPDTTNGFLGGQLGLGAGFVGAIGKTTSPLAWARLDAHSPQNLQAYVYADVTGTVDVVASTAARGRIAILAVGET